MKPSLCFSRQFIQKFIGFYIITVEGYSMDGNFTVKLDFSQNYRGGLKIKKNPYVKNVASGNTFIKTWRVCKNLISCSVAQRWI